MGSCALVCVCVCVCLCVLVCVCSCSSLYVCACVHKCVLAYPVRLGECEGNKHIVQTCDDKRGS